MNNSITVRNPDKLEYWINTIKECENSKGNLSVIKWCLARDIDPRTYYYWHKKIVKLYGQQEEQNDFYEVSNFSSSTNAPAATIHSGSLSMDIYNGADAATITNICRMLGIC